FAGAEQKSSKSAVINAIGFVLGFTIVFVALGAAAGTFGRFIRDHQTALNIAGGSFLILAGLNYMNIIKLNFLNNTKKINVKIKTFTFFSSILFGFLFSFAWTPCVGSFLSSALMMAATQGESSKGILHLLFYSLGLGIPFILSAVLIDSLKGAFHFIKKHYSIINKICGLLLIIIGLFMMFGFFNTLLSFFSF
ncbi:MAG: cytochrome C biogenesis protein ResB, partial [Clostridiales bacterium 43-6]